MQQPIPLYAFTIKFSQRVGVLATEIGVRNLPPTTLNHESLMRYGILAQQIRLSPERLLMLWTLRLLVLQGIKRRMVNAKLACTLLTYICPTRLC